MTTTSVWSQAKHLVYATVDLGSGGPSEYSSTARAKRIAVVHSISNNPQRIVRKSRASVLSAWRLFLPNNFYTQCNDQFARRSTQTRKRRLPVL